MKRNKGREPMFKDRVWMLTTISKEQRDNLKKLARIKSSELNMDISMADLTRNAIAYCYPETMKGCKEWNNVEVSYLLSEIKQNKPYKDIAEILGRSYKSLKSKMERLRKEESVGN